MVLFAAIYLRVTPFCELSLIRQGIVALALSLGGHHRLLPHRGLQHPAQRQLPDVPGLGRRRSGGPALTCWLLGCSVPRLPDLPSANNVGCRAFAGTVALVVGIINAACMS